MVSETSPRVPPAAGPGQHFENAYLLKFSTVSSSRSNSAMFKAVRAGFASRLHVLLASAPARRLLCREDGAAAVEFALVAAPFLALIFAIIETALVFFAGQYLETVVADSSRLIMTGQVQTQGLGQSQFLNLIEKLRLAEPLGLHLPGHDQPAGIGNHGLEILAGEEHQGGFDDGEYQRQERRRHQREFDRRGAVLAAKQPPRGRRCEQHMQAGSEPGADGFEHRRVAPA